MSLLKLALPLLVLGFLPLAAMAQAPPASTFGKISLTVGDPVGLLKEDNMMVVPYKGNVTVPVTVTFDCSLLAYEFGHQAGKDINHFHVQPADDKLPPWLVADEFLTYFPPVANGAPDDPSFPVQTCESGAGTYSQTVDYPFAVTAAAPGIITQQLNLTANLADDAFAAPVPVLFAVQFHANYTVEPSVQFPLTVMGNSANFTVTVTNTANARGMVMIEELHSSTGQLSGLASVPYQPPETKTFEVQFKAPSTCWTNATVTFKSFAHFLLLDQRAGSYHDEVDHTWELKNGIACTPGKGNTESKKSPVGGLVVLPAVLGAALLARRRIL